MRHLLAALLVLTSQVATAQTTVTTQAPNPWVGTPGSSRLTVTTATTATAAPRCPEGRILVLIPPSRAACARDLTEPER